MRLNLKEFKELIKIFNNYTDLSDKICEVFGPSNNTLDAYNGDLFDFILKLCGYTDDMLDDHDPVIFNYDLKHDLDKLYNDILVEISDYKIKMNPDPDIF